MQLSLPASLKTSSDSLAVVGAKCPSVSFSYSRLSVLQGACEVGRTKLITEWWAGEGANWSFNVGR